MHIYQRTDVVTVSADKKYVRPRANSVQYKTRVLCAMKIFLSVYHELVNAATTVRFTQLRPTLTHNALLRLE